MPLYIIERNFAEKIDINADGVLAISKINGDVGVSWLFSFLRDSLINGRQDQSSAEATQGRSPRR